ncbi:hypothetical protein M413DRAFT_448806 [Hebeloma cylindrosporum]|uniref:Uncharacterized protein n=1 Tax=Hebeloma cylindrosporum TaxID=76867 RepID=A0A0C2Y752_HEBCY|nr:hypothetical protein M413DRAFT_448806 [Hebeloma cylindrosporum h7]
MASPPTQAGPPGLSHFPSPTTIVSFASSSSSTTVHPSTVTTVVTSIAATQTSQPQTSQQSSKSELTTLQIAAIAIGSSLLVLALVAGLAYLLFVRREKRRRSGTTPKTPGATEKYGEDSEYTLSYNQTPRDHGGTAPLLKSPTGRSRAVSGLSFISSQYDNESRRFPSQDGPSSRFINGEDEITQTPLSHAVSLADATPNAQPEENQYAQEENHLDSATLLPYLSPSTSSPHLAVVPDTSPPTRRSSRRKNPWNGSGYDSDDSDSMYSQASASTVRLHDAPSTSAIHALPASVAAAPDFIPSSSQQIPHLSIGTALEDESEQNRMAEEHSILVARLLMSRTKHAPGQPSRNSSVISHIERSGSIKPVLEGENGEPRGTRHLQKLRARESKKSYKPRLSTTAMGEEELERSPPPPPPRSPSS